MGAGPGGEVTEPGQGACAAADSWSWTGLENPSAAAAAAGEFAAGGPGGGLKCPLPPFLLAEVGSSVPWVAPLGPWLPAAWAYDAVSSVAAAVAWDNQNLEVVGTD